MTDKIEQKYPANFQLIVMAVHCLPGLLTTPATMSALSMYFTTGTATSFDIVWTNPL